MESHDVVVVGGGQAGLSVSYHLKDLGIEHVVLESGRVAESWRTQRWDSFCLVTPNHMFALPGMPYDGDDPDGFLTKEGIVARFERYQKRFGLPVRMGVRVQRAAREGEGYRVETSEGALLARNVVVAAGAYPRPRVLPASRDVPPEIRQVHSIDYRNPQSLPPGAILVVGSGQSGAQIAEELHRSGRRVFLALGSCPRAPRRYRGRDLLWWLARLGLTEQRPQDLKDAAEQLRCHPILTGRDGGREIDLRGLAAEGMTLVGRLQGGADGVLRFAPSANATLDAADGFGRKVMESIDGYIVANGLALPPDEETRARFAPVADRLPERTEIDLRAEGISTVLWATGFRQEFPWLELPVFDAEGRPRHRRGVTEAPGVFFLGLPYLSRNRSESLFGVADDAAYVAARIAARLEESRPKPAEPIAA